MLPFIVFGALAVVLSLIFMVSLPPAGTSSALVLILSLSTGRLSIYLSTRQAENTGDLIFLYFKKVKLKTRTPTTKIQSYFCSAHQALNGEPQENIMKPIIASVNLNSAI